MCRSIVSLRDQGRRASPDEVSAAARQFVRKISGTRTKAPSRANREAFDRAIDEIARSAARLLDDWEAPPYARRDASATSPRGSGPTTLTPAATAAGDGLRES